MTHPFLWKWNPGSPWDSSLRRKSISWKTPAKLGVTTAPPTDTKILLFLSLRGIMQKNWISGCSSADRTRGLGPRGSWVWAPPLGPRPSGSTSRGLLLCFIRYKIWKYNHHQKRPYSSSLELQSRFRLVQATLSRHPYMLGCSTHIKH